MSNYTDYPHESGNPSPSLELGTGESEQPLVVSPAQQIDNRRTKIKIKIIGVGGAGGNIVNYMINNMYFPKDIVSFYAANTDSEALDGINLPVENKIYLHDKDSYISGNGAGTDPDVARKAAEYSKEELIEKLSDAHMIFAVGGLGKGTGTGALPYITDLIINPKLAAKEKGSHSESPVIIVGVTTPFELEGKKRKDAAMSALKQLYQKNISIIKIPNEKIFELDDIWSVDEAFDESNKVMGQSITGITDIIDHRGKTNLDFKDILRFAKQYPGNTLIGAGSAEFPVEYSMTHRNKSEMDQTPIMIAARRAVEQDLIDNFSFNNAKGLIINYIVPSRKYLSKDQFQYSLNFIKSKANNDDVDVTFGIVYQDQMPLDHRNYLDPETTDKPLEVKITVVATGIPEREEMPQGLQVKTPETVWPAYQQYSQQGNATRITPHHESHQREHLRNEAIDLDFDPFKP